MSFEWLNEYSQKFLERGYLIKGVTAQERVKQIADRAEEILGIEGYSDKFYDYMGKGYYSLSSPVWSNFGTNKGLPISCVTGDTWINTSDGGKQAKDIQLNDLVLTHKNRFRKVVKVIPTKDRGDIWKIKVGTRMTDLFATGDHVVLTNTGWKRVDELDKGKDLMAVNGELSYTPKSVVLDMKKHTDYNYIIENGLIKKAVENKRLDKALKNNIEESHVTYYAQIPEHIEIDEDLAWAIGLWFADGSITVNDKGKPNGIRLTGNINDRHTIVKRWTKIIEDKFNVNTGEYLSKVERNGKDNEWVTVNVNSKVVGNLFNSFGRGAKNKLIPEDLLCLDKPILNELLTGVLDGDGSPKQNGDIVKLTLSNPKLLLQVYNIGLKLGKPMSLQMKEKAGKFASTEHAYTIVFRECVNSASRNNVRSGIPFSDGLIYVPIHTLEKTDKVEDVYDFTVEEDHSFSCSGVVVHNCYGSNIADYMGDILRAQSEVGMMSKLGGGTAGYFGNLRPRGSEITNNGTSSGAVHFMRLFESVIDTVSQGSSRRGRFSPYLPIDHPDIDEFLDIGTEGNSIQELTHAVTVTDEWMQKMIDGDKEKRRIWAKLIQKRVELGYPYILFSDTVNRETVDVYKDKGMKINHSQLCSEITLPTNDEWSFVCCLASMNILHYDKWKDTDAVETMIYFLDAVMSEFITKLEAFGNSELREDQLTFEYMKKAYKFAVEHRALGLGALGWHSYLQSKMIPFESLEAKALNAYVFKTIHDKAYKASEELAKLYGEPKVLEGYGRRNTCLLAIAPTTSSAFILGQVSQSIEPIWSNNYVKDLAKDKVTIQNPYLKKLLQEKGKDTRDVWIDIRNHDGSVQHLDFLTEYEKQVFKTFSEINQFTILDQASVRQKFIDQSQSLNIMVNPKTTAKEINELYLFAWENGIKTLYYQHSTNAAQQLNKDKLCIACEA